jgi:hypothetical protein
MFTRRTRRLRRGELQTAHSYQKKCKRLSNVRAQPVAYSEQSASSASCCCSCGCGCGSPRASRLRVKKNFPQHYTRSGKPRVKFSAPPLPPRSPREPDEPATRTNQTNHVEPRKSRNPSPSNQPPRTRYTSLAAPKRVRHAAGESCNSDSSCNSPRVRA